jgi:hypothetical protein
MSEKQVSSGVQVNESGSSKQKYRPYIESSMREALELIKNGKKIS